MNYQVMTREAQERFDYLLDNYDNLTEKELTEYEFLTKLWNLYVIHLGLCRESKI